MKEKDKVETVKKQEDKLKQTEGKSKHNDCNRGINEQKSWLKKQLIKSGDGVKDGEK